MASAEPTTVGNYFVSNYPPYSFWREDDVRLAQQALQRAPLPGAALGLYIHIPFCRQRCDFCYFKVYTDKSGKEVRRYVDAVLAEFDRYADLPVLAGRSPRFVYFGGGTPSYLNTEQITRLFGGLRSRISFDAVEEVTFECEPGTLQEGKAQLLRSLGVTRLSLGVENFDPEILERNNRAHRAVEIERAVGFIRDAGYQQFNLDLIAGMIGETDENWADCIAKTRAIAPESVTIYQMEVPYNTTMYQRMKDEGAEQAPVADWETKRRWVEEAFDALKSDGYEVGSAYTAYRPGTRFLYRDSLWHGADMLGLGVSAFSHVSGVHFQNEHTFEHYVSRVEQGERPIHRAHVCSDEELLIREFILQMKLGHVRPAYFQEKFGVDVLSRFSGPLQAQLASGDLAVVTPEEIRASSEGLLCIDRLLHDYFLEEHRGARFV